VLAAILDTTAPGEFAVVDASTLEAWLPDTLQTTRVLPVQVWVTSAASAPRWLRVIP